MKRVNIYVYSTNKSPNPMEYAGGYILEYIGKGGPVTKSQIKKGEEKQNAMNSELITIVESLRRLNTECEVMVYAYGKVQDAIEAGWIEKWNWNGWMTSKGTPIKCAEEWKSLRGLMMRHVVEFSKAHHSYSDWLERECRKELESNV